MSRGGHFQDGSVVAMLQSEYNNPVGGIQNPHHTNVGHAANNSNNQDAFNLQYLELEEFLLDNQVAIVQQNQEDTKVFSPEHHPNNGVLNASSPNDLMAAEKQYQINLEHRAGGYGGNLMISTNGITNGGPLTMNPTTIITADPNSPPQSNCDSPIQDQSQQSPTGGDTLSVQQHQQQQHHQQQQQMMAATTARKTVPRRISTSSNSSSLVVTPPHTPQQASPNSLSAQNASNSISELLMEIPEDNKKRKVIRRSKKESVPQENKDEKYWRRRAKNNEAAKRSRDLRREKENHILQRVTFLEKENTLLHQELETIKMENEELRERLSRYEVL